jgi:thiamine monophosphate synthase
LASGAAGVAVMGVGIMRAANPAVEVKGLIAALCGR